LRIHSSVHPFPLGSDFVVIALARRCTSLPTSSIIEPVCSSFCVAYVSPFVVCFLRVPVCTRPFCSPPALRLRSRPCLPCVHIVFPFSFARASFALPRLRLSTEPVCPESLFAFPRLTSASRGPVCTRTHSIPRCRCHVTQTNWSRAFAASSLVAQDTTHPSNTSIPPHARERSEYLTTSHTNLCHY